METGMERIADRGEHREPGKSHKPVFQEERLADAQSTD